MEKRLEVKPVLLKDVVYNEDMFIPLKTNHPLMDNFISGRGGIMPATNTIIIGDPGVGKSTISLDLAASIAFSHDPKEVENKKDVLFISAEMSQIDMYEYVQRYPKFKYIPSIFISEYLEYDPKDVIESVFLQGWDLIVIDSWAEITELVKAYHKWTSTQAENWLLSLLAKHNAGGNEKNKYTAYYIIQQVTKGGQFVGSNRLKHMTTAMIEARFDEENNGGVRYMYFSKNRRGEVGRRIKFILSDGNVSYTHFDVTEMLLS